MSETRRLMTWYRDIKEKKDFKSPKQTDHAYWVLTVWQTSDKVCWSSPHRYPWWRHHYSHCQVERAQGKSYFHEWLQVRQTVSVRWSQESSPGHRDPRACSCTHGHTSSLLNTMWEVLNELSCRPDLEMRKVSLAEVAQVIVSWLECKELVRFEYAFRDV